MYSYSDTLDLQNYQTQTPSHAQTKKHTHTPAHTPLPKQAKRPKALKALEKQPRLLLGVPQGLEWDFSEGKALGRKTTRQCTPGGPDAHRFRGKGPGGWAQPMGGARGQWQEQTAWGCGVSLTRGWPGLSSGYQGQGKPRQTPAGQTLAGAGVEGSSARGGEVCSSAPLGCLQFGKFLAQETAGQKPSVRPGPGEDADPRG